TVSSAGGSSAFWCSRVQSWCVVLLEGLLQAVEPPVPVVSEPVDPRSGLVQRPGVARQEVLPPDPPALHQLRALQDPDVLGDRIERDVERRGEVRDPRLPLCQAAEDGAPGGGGEGTAGAGEA